MSIVAVVAGAYTGTYNSNPLAYTRRGWNVNFAQKVERIEESDLYGETLIDEVYRGGTITIDTICRVYSTNVTAALQPWGGAVGQVYTSARPIGQLASAQNAGAGNALVLTVVSSTPAVGNINTLTAKVIIAADQLQIMLNSQARDVPVRFDVLLSDNTGTGTLLTLT